MSKETVTNAEPSRESFERQIINLKKRIAELEAIQSKLSDMLDIASTRINEAERRAEQAEASKKRLIAAIKNFPRHDRYATLYEIAKEEDGKG